MLGKSHKTNQAIERSRLVGSVVAGGCTWPQLADSEDWKVSTVLGLWYSSLLLAVTATSAATQQIVALSRLSSHPDGLKRIRYMLCLACLTRMGSYGPVAGGPFFGRCHLAC